VPLAQKYTQGTGNSYSSQIEHLPLWSAGEEADVLEYVRRIRGLRWQAMAVRYEEGDLCQPEQALDSLRLFKCKHITELSPEGGLSELGKFCKQAGLQHMFLAALKIT
jgi:hypothetical protein